MISRWNRRRTRPRFPGVVLAAARPQLRALPPGFRLDQYRDAHGRLDLPLARGRISFVRRVREAGTIDLPGGDLPGRASPGPAVCGGHLVHASPGDRRQAGRRGGQALPVSDPRGGRSSALPAAPRAGLTPVPPPAVLAAPHRWARCSPRRAPLCPGGTRLRMVYDVMAVAIYAGIGCNSAIVPAE